ncbi:hypothetical protein D1159_17830 [Pseudoflavonifractor sp. 524-17]|nr:hypothetical protein [Pseudoflavonifractor sp. 524-17]
MKCTVIRHNLTALDLSKKARPPPGGTAAMKLYYTMQCKPSGGSMTCRAVFVVSCGPENFLHFFLCGKRFCAQNLCR